MKGIVLFLKFYNFIVLQALIKKHWTSKHRQINGINRFPWLFPIFSIRYIKLGVSGKVLSLKGWFVPWFSLFVTRAELGLPPFEFIQGFVSSNGIKVLFVLSTIQIVANTIISRLVRQSDEDCKTGVNEQKDFTKKVKRILTNFGLVNLWWSILLCKILSYWQSHQILYQIALV